MKKFTLKTLSEVEDIVISTLAELDLGVSDELESRGSHKFRSGRCGRR